jgi:hypothetical protein
MESRCTHAFVQCEKCKKFLVVEHRFVCSEIVAVCDVVEVTKMGDEFKSFAPIYPPHFYCGEHDIEEKIYTIQEIKNNVWL